MGRSAMSSITVTTDSLRRSPVAADHHSDDPLLPWLRSIHTSLENFRRAPQTTKPKLKALLEECLQKFDTDDRYQNDIRFLKIWIIYADVIQDFQKVLRMLEAKGICLGFSLLYEAYAKIFISKEELVEAAKVLHRGISRKAEPLDRLKTFYAVFLEQVAQKEKMRSQVGATVAFVPDMEEGVNPWSNSTISSLLQKMKFELEKLSGFHRSNKAFSGKVSLASLKTASRNKIIDIGGSKYHIKGCSGRGNFAQVFKAYVNNNPDEVVALKIQTPAFPWEFYMYCQIDKHISEDERSSFGHAHKVHVYSDWSILVCDYLSHGTLQDAINSHLVMGKVMDEVLCMYYTIEMLRMLENLHNVGLIHGDFKPDNLLVRYAGDALTEQDFIGRAGPWRDQGLCLVDWGRGIDVKLFPKGIEFKGDCRTSGFRCIEMQEKRTWTYQVDTYGLCVNVHMMLFGTYMTVEKRISDGVYKYLPKSPFKRYWNTRLWETLFSSLLNIDSCESDVLLLHSLRKSFENCICEKPQLIKDLKYLLAKQKNFLCSS